MHIDTESQGNRHDEDEIGLESGGDLITLSHQFLADRMYRVEAEYGGGSLNAPPAPGWPECYPAKPEPVCGG